MWGVGADGEIEARELRGGVGRGGDGVQGREVPLKFLRRAQVLEQALINLAIGDCDHGMCAEAATKAIEEGWAAGMLSRSLLEELAVYPQVGLPIGLAAARVLDEDDGSRD